MLDGFLLVVFSIFVFATFNSIRKKSLLFAGLYIFIFIYSIFAQIGYCYYPELSELIKAYFGKYYFYKFYFFNFLSFIFFYIFFIFSFPYLSRIKKYEIVKDKATILPLLFCTYILFVWGYLISYLILNYQSISYDNAYSEEYLAGQGLPFRIFIALFKLLVPLILIFYCQVRIKNRFTDISFFKKNLVNLMFTISILLFLFIANKLGSRTDIVAITLGIVIFEYCLGFNYKKVLSFVIAGGVIVGFLLYLEQTRTVASSQFEDLLIGQKILMKDYFAPAHILYAAMGLNYINPLEVLYSNLSNSLILLNYPYLQAPVTELINPGVATRSAGYAFYIFSEGFIFMGFFGFLYNGFMLMTGATIWHLFKNAKNKYYSFLILAIMSTQFANIARSQSSYFFKDLYIIFLPVLIIFYLSSGLRPKFFHS